MINKFVTLVLAVGISVVSYGCGQAQAGKTDSPTTPKAVVEEPKTPPAGEVIKISQEEFASRVFDYKASAYAFLGARPVIVDFNADWCGPCRRLAPIVEELAAEYAGKIDFYSVNIDDNRELANALGIESIPMLLFIPRAGQPQASVGLLPKEAIEEAINEVLFPSSEK